VPTAALAQQPLKSDSAMTPDHPPAGLLRKLSEALETRSSAKLTMQVLTNGVLGADMRQWLRDFGEIC
jgi:TRAP-type C4-dicarboxylate transport system substrate-binding protein